MQEWMKKISGSCLPILLGTGAALFYNSISNAGWGAFPAFFAAFFLVVLTQTVWRYRKQRWLQILGVILLVVGSLYVTWQCVGNPERRILFLSGLAKWSDFAPILLIIPLSFVPKTIWGRAISAFGILVMLIVVAWSEKMLGKGSILILFLYILGVLTELVNRGTYGKRNFEEKRYLQLVGCVMPAFLVLILLISTFKIPEKPMEWRLVKDAWQAMQDAGRNISSRILWYFDTNEDEFAIRFSGYDEVVTIEGEIRTTKREELSITTNQKLNQVLYLVGNYKNTYTGEGWMDSTSSLPYEGQYTDGLVDTWELLYAANRAGMEFEDLFRNRRISLNYRDLRTVTIFQAANTWVVEPDEIRGEPYPYESRYASLRWEEEPRWDFGYQIRYLDLNLGHEEFKQFVIEQENYCYGKIEEETPEEEELYSNVEKNWHYQVNGTTTEMPDTLVQLEELLRERAERIKKEYTALPKAMPALPP